MISSHDIVVAVNGVGSVGLFFCMRRRRCEGWDGVERVHQELPMKLLAKPSLALRAVLFVALAVAVAALLFHQAAPPREGPADGRRVVRAAATTTYDRMEALAMLRAHSSAIANGGASGIIFSGAASPGDILTSYLAAAGYIRCGRVCTLTAKGGAQHWSVKPLLGDLTQITVPLGDLTVGKATRIQSGIIAGNTPQTSVDFSYRVRANALGRAMLAWAGSRRFCGVDYAARWNGAQSGEAVFTKDDGGWRLAKAASTSGASNPFGVACAMP
jgi:hypothetical protein